MAKKDLVEQIEIPQGVTVQKEGAELIIRGTKGEVRRKYDNPYVKIEVQSSKMVLTSLASSKREKAIISAYVAHLKNALKGVVHPFTYKLKVCSGHFPMNVSISGKLLLIKNFLGEKVPRQVKLQENVDVKLDGNYLNIESCDKERAGQMAAAIEQATRRPGFDKRIFQDGIYLIEKAGKEI